MSAVTGTADLLVLLSLAVTLLAGVPFLRDERLRRHGVRVVGEVVAHGAPGHRRARYAVAFTTLTGQHVRHETRARATPPAVGRALTVLYDPRRPRHAAPAHRVDPYGRWARVLVPCAAAVCVLAAAARIVCAFL
ncbi:DUF3592 domain-containing protein [Streptomyces sp. RFCAC02]|uniref:DUF3592 domain-containing protein n=1 Tax=Streptomyces sp. RFCAC02 TaxID=2499143 RepID=UPI00143DE8E4|nr:DUF3592 domain-containing protein [Streptomyces sp. RFCAC02]